MYSFRFVSFQKIQFADLFRTTVFKRFNLRINFVLRCSKDSICFGRIHIWFPHPYINYNKSKVGIKDVGIVHESSNLGFFCFQNQSKNWIFRIWICKNRQPGFVRIRDLQILIFKDSFCAIVVRIREDLLDLWKQVESFENWLDSWSRYKPNLFKSGFVIDCTNQIFLSPDLWPTNRYEFMDSQNKSMFLQISYTIPASSQYLLWQS